MPRVLIVDDNPLDRHLAAGFVSGGPDVEVENASNGVEALEIVERSRPDVVITDLDMPEMDGLKLVHEIRHKHPSMPIILMTAKGSEEVASQALAAGAASYVPKRNMKSDLPRALQIAWDVNLIRAQDQLVFSMLQDLKAEFCLGYNSKAQSALVNHLQAILRGAGLCDENQLVRIGTALTEAIVNAVEHGNLELDSKLREEMDSNPYRDLARERIRKAPYKDRRVHISVEIKPKTAEITIRDEGPGFDPMNLPDPTDPENLLLPHGRGLMLIRSFIDDVRFNPEGNQITLVIKKQRAAAVAV